jgi:hypothetical protein
MPARSLSDSSHPPHARVPASSARPDAAPRASSRVNHGGTRPFKGRSAGSRAALASPDAARTVAQEAAEGQPRVERIAARGAT